MPFRLASDLVVPPNLKTVGAEMMASSSHTPSPSSPPPRFFSVNEFPEGMKFDPSDEQLLLHLKRKLGVDGARQHVDIDRFIVTLGEADVACGMHPELIGSKKDGVNRHYFHQESQTHGNGTRMKRKILTLEDDKEVQSRWHKTGKTRPVLANKEQIGFKKIMVLYTCPKKAEAPKCPKKAEAPKAEKPHPKDNKTNWVMHQYHWGDEASEASYKWVVSKVFWQVQPRKSTPRGGPAKAGGVGSLVAVDEDEEPEGEEGEEREDVEGGGGEGGEGGREGEEAEEQARTPATSAVTTMQEEEEGSVRRVAPQRPVPKRFPAMTGAFDNKFSAGLNGVTGDVRSFLGHGIGAAAECSPPATQQKLDQVRVWQPYARTVEVRKGDRPVGRAPNAFRACQSDAASSQEPRDRDDDEGVVMSLPSDMWDLPERGTSLQEQVPAPPLHDSLPPTNAGSQGNELDSRQAYDAQLLCQEGGDALNFDEDKQARQGGTNPEGVLSEQVAQGFRAPDPNRASREQMDGEEGFGRSLVHTRAFRDVQAAGRPFSNAPLPDQLAGPSGVGEVSAGMFGRALGDSQPEEEGGVALTPPLEFGDGFLSTPPDAALLQEPRQSQEAHERYDCPNEICYNCEDDIKAEGGLFQTGTRFDAIPEPSAPAELLIDLADVSHPNPESHRQDEDKENVPGGQMEAGDNAKDAPDSEPPFLTSSQGFSDLNLSQLPGISSQDYEMFGSTFSPNSVPIQHHTDGAQPVRGEGVEALEGVTGAMSARLTPCSNFPFSPERCPPSWTLSQPRCLSPSPSPVPHMTLEDSLEDSQGGSLFRTIQHNAAATVSGQRTGNDVQPEVLSEAVRLHHALDQSVSPHLMAHESSHRSQGANIENTKGPTESQEREILTESPIPINGLSHAVLTSTHDASSEQTLDDQGEETEKSMLCPASPAATFYRSNAEALVGTKDGEKGERKLRTYVRGSVGGNAEAAPYESSKSKGVVQSPPEGRRLRRRESSMLSPPTLLSQEGTTTQPASRVLRSNGPSKRQRRNEEEGKGSHRITNFFGKS
eukprot:TRINITY_DN14146_c1_g1_i1.p1 TRINITY_DN14146_c1_g1~~TRINITY_DN14146_c1_g1_i1.p1  ORF type:complete len:1048 (-),score=209.29 TRINITY_DN14146_c1_g1_i1:1545-4688(-)